MRECPNGSSCPFKDVKSHSLEFQHNIDVVVIDDSPPPPVPSKRPVIRDEIDLTSPENNSSNNEKFIDKVGTNTKKVDLSGGGGGEWGWGGPIRLHPPQNKVLIAEDGNIKKKKINKKKDVDSSSQEWGARIPKSSGTSTSSSSNGGGGGVGGGGGGGGSAGSKGGKGKKRKCPHGKSCKYQHEYQHQLEFSHDDEPVQNKTTSSEGNKKQSGAGGGGIRLGSIGSKFGQVTDDAAGRNDGEIFCNICSKYIPNAAMAAHRLRHDRTGETLRYEQDRQYEQELINSAAEKDREKEAERKKREREEALEFERAIKESRVLNFKEERIAAQQQLSLLPEVSPSTASSISLRLVLPNSKKLSRRFLLSEPFNVAMLMLKSEESLEGKKYIVRDSVGVGSGGIREFNEREHGGKSFQELGIHQNTSFVVVVTEEEEEG